jgi:hypothetical protein
MNEELQEIEAMLHEWVRRARDGRPIPPEVPKRLSELLEDYPRLAAVFAIGTAGLMTAISLRQVTDE